MPAKDSSPTQTSEQPRAAADRSAGVNTAISLPAVPAFDQEQEPVSETNALQLQAITVAADAPPPPSDPSPVVQTKSSTAVSSPIVGFTPLPPVQKVKEANTQPSPHGFKPIQKKENKTGLPDNLKSGIENLSGYQMDDVKVHYNSAEPKQLQAHAYAQGTDIHVAPGQEKHLAHEAWHVVQQKQGRVQATTQMKSSVPVNDDVGLEQEADTMGAAAMAKSNEITVEAGQQSTIPSPVVQGVFGSEEYRPQWQPGMAALGGAKAAGEAGIAGAKGAAELGWEGVKGSAGLAKEGAEGSLGLGWKGVEKSVEGAGAGINKSIGLAGAGMDKSAGLAASGMAASGALAEKGIMGSASLAGSGIMASGNLALEGAKGSMALAGSGIEASGKLASAPARWAKKGMAGTNSKLKKAGYAIAGGLGTLVSAPVGLAGAVGSGVLGAAGAVGSGALGAAGAVGSGALGAAGVIGSGALGAAGAIGSGALGAAGVVGSGALGAAGVIGSGALGAVGAVGSGALGAAGAVGAGALGAVGAAGSTALGAAGAVGAGALGATGAAVGGGLGAVGMLGGGVYKGGKAAKQEIGETVNKGLLGIYDKGASHPAYGDKQAGMEGNAEQFNPDGTRKAYGAISKHEGVQYGLLGGGGASAVGASITDMASKGNIVGDSIRDKGFVSPMAGGAEAFGSLGAIGGVLGAGAALADAKNAGGAAADKANSGNTRVLAGAQATSSIADATKSTASAAYNIASLIDAKGAAAAGAQVAAGGAAIAMGAVDMLRGGYGVYTTTQRADALEGIAKGAEKKLQESKAADVNRMMEGAPKPPQQIAEEVKLTDVINTAREAKATQERSRVTSASQIVKGGLAIAGGILLAVSMATPIGWMLLGVGAVVGIGAAIANWWSKRSQKKVVAMRELGVTEAMEKYEKGVEAVKARTKPLTNKRKEEKAKLGPNPLKQKLKEFNFTSVGHFYSNYINATANKIFTDGVVGGDASYTAIISNIGLKVEKKGEDKSKWQPTPAKIAKALSG